MIILVEPAPGPLVTDWIQTAATLAGILIAALVAVRVSRNEHDRQILHQSKKDVAEALTVLQTVMDEYFAVKTLAELSPASLELEDIKAAAERSEAPLRRLESLSKLVQLTSPDRISRSLRTVVFEAEKFRILMMTTVHAHTRVDLMARMGETGQLGPTTSADEYEAQWERITEAEKILTVVTMDYDLFWGPGSRLRLLWSTLRGKVKPMGRNKSSKASG